LTSEGESPTVLFVCVSNAGKSVMAQHLARQIFGARITALSAGTHAKAAINPLSASVLAELGIDASGHTPKQLDDNLIRDADRIVILGNEAQIDHPADTPVERWDTDEPSHRGIDGIERMRLIRDDIERRVRSLGSGPADPDG
jgi:arsenate-mycothiol transferase